VADTPTPTAQDPSATPWLVLDSETPSIFAADAEGNAQMVALVVRRADADRIAAAVNSYSDLLAIARAVAGDYPADDDDFCVWCDPTAQHERGVHQPGCTWVKARDLLASGVLTTGAGT
jgi:hypothetical protein